MNARLAEFFEVTITELEKSRAKRLEEVKNWKNRIAQEEAAISRVSDEILTLMRDRDILLTKTPPNG